MSLSSSQILSKSQQAVVNKPTTAFIFFRVSKRFSVECYVDGLFAFAGNLQSAARHQERKHQNKAARIDVEIEILHFSATATQEQYYQ